MARFTDRFIKGLKPKDKRYEVRGEKGFAVWVAPTGTKTWMFIYTFKGKKRRVTLGAYPGMDLKSAGEVAKDLRECLERGHDPVEWRDEQVRKEEEARLKELRIPTVAELANGYVEKWAKPRKRSWSEDARMLNKDVVPLWGNRKARDITRYDVIKLLDGLQERGATITANRTLAVIRKMFNWGAENGLVDMSLCAGIRAPVQENRRDKVLTVDEIRSFWKGLDNAGMTDGSRLALKFQFYTGQRKGEVVAASWAEFDLKEMIWTIPPKNSKNKMPHRVPLSDGAMVILEQIKSLAGDSPYLFPSPREGKHVAATSIDHVIRRNLDVFGAGQFTPHDLRRTAASHMTAMGISRLVVSKILNHAEAGVTAVYDRHSYDLEKRQALDTWGRKLAEIISGKHSENVVHFIANKTG
ncbi:MAG: tyrosine-type recombinase/integrase [Magnetococcales bacterium]|nr:tyrosine-type recombinase/integrase [Magnetococcales bacterium]